MAIRKIKRNITPVKSIATPEEVVISKIEDESSAQLTVESKPERSKKICSFCQNKSNPSYTDLGNLRRFLTDRAKIVGKERSGVCSRHQREVAKNIKYARHLALLPFVPKV